MDAAVWLGGIVIVALLVVAVVAVLRGGDRDEHDDRHDDVGPWW